MRRLRMRIRSLVLVGLITAPFAALGVAASCTVATTNLWPDIHYVTVCALDQGGFTDGTQTFDHAYVAHVSQAAEADPAFVYSQIRTDQNRWAYDDGEVHQSRETTEIGGGTFAGARGLAGGGWHANVVQREQTAGEDAGDACSSFIGSSTCFGAGGWFTVQDVASVGVGGYYEQKGTGGACAESASVYVDAAAAFVPVLTEPAPCTAEAPAAHDEASFWDLPVLP